MLDRFWYEIPPVTRIIMLQQFAGLAIYSLGYAERYDLYFNLDKIIWEGQVRTYVIYTVYFISRSGAFLLVFSSSKGSTSIPSFKLCSCISQLI